MKDRGKLILNAARWTDYHRFKNLCCVENMPPMNGPCWTLAMLSEVDNSYIAPDAGFIGYCYPFRNNAARLATIEQIRGFSRRRTMAWLNRNLRILSRVMVRPEFRHMGIATELVRMTVEKVGVPYIECLTFSALIASILSNTGFVNYGQTMGLKCDYWLWVRPSTGSKKREQDQFEFGHKA